MYKEIKSYISFDNEKYSYIDEGGIINVYRCKEFQRLASKPEINMFYKLIDLEKSHQIEYDCDGKRMK